MSYAQMQGKSLYINPGQGLYFSNKEKQITAFNHEQLSVVSLISNNLIAANLTVSDSTTLNNLTSTDLTVSNSTTLNNLTVSNLTINNSLTFGLYNLCFGIATLEPADTTSYPSYISNPNYNDGHGNSNYTITQSVNTIVGCVINPINNSKFVITYVSQTSSNQIYVSWVNLTNGSYTLPTNVSYVIWST